MEAVELAYEVFEPEEMDPNTIPVLLMHGIFWNKYMFKDIASDLCRELQTKVFSLDLRNHGESPAPEECNIYLMAEDVKKFMRDKDLKKVNFVCHSISVTVSYLVLLDQPHSVHKLVMIDNSPYPEFNPDFNYQNVVHQVKAQNRLLNSLDPQMTLKDAKSKFYNLAAAGNIEQGSFYKKAAYDLTKKNGKFKWKIDLDFLVERYISGDLWPKPRGSSDHEILILRCRNSARVTDEKFAAVVKHNPKAKLVTFEDTTHVLLFERPETFLEVVKDFLLSNTNDFPRETVV